VVDPERVRGALFALRLLTGGTLILLAYTEKLARPELSLAFLDRYPAFNLLQLLGGTSASRSATSPSSGSPPASRSCSGCC
jgi:hypothetical protein